MKMIKVKYVADKKSIYFKKGKVYGAFLPEDNKTGNFLAFHIEDIDEPGDYALPASMFEIIEGGGNVGLMQGSHEERLRLCS